MGPSTVRFLFYSALIAIAVGHTVDRVTYDEDGYHGHRLPEPAKMSVASARETKEHWYNLAQQSLDAKIKTEVISKKAKNIIFFLGDGMSVPTLTAARILKGQLQDGNNGGEEAELHMETFPNVAMSKTFCVDSQVADSACTATAYLCGTKANDGTIGVSPEVKLGECAKQNITENQVTSILKWAQDAGKSTGVVTTTRITHASPSGNFAHTAHRDWEDDSAIRYWSNNPGNPDINPEDCDDIAQQLIRHDPGRNINVIFGGGSVYFLPNTTNDIRGNTGRRYDGKNLVEDWKTQKAGKKHQYIEKLDELNSLTSDTEYVLGLFSPTHLDYFLDRENRTEELRHPTLDVLTRKAIEILSKNPNGFYLFVEGGRIDHAHHDGKAKKSLYETLEFDKAIKVADEMTSKDDTLILVTADHAHTMSIQGYSRRGHDIFGVSQEIGTDGLPVTTLSYANGPGYKNPVPDVAGGCKRYNISSDDIQHKDYRQLVTSPLPSETHGGDDVVIYSRGPMSHLLTGVQQQSYIPHLLGYAACVGSGKKFCSESDRSGMSNLSAYPIIVLISLASVLMKRH